jgi:endonuclease/exonuclease/phosphatase family metal-dependent hydrolase
VRIVTYNFLSGGSRHRDGHWSRIKRAFQPDFVLAQEARPPQSKRVSASQKGTLLWEPVQGRRWGSALLSEPAISPISIPGFDGWVIGGEVSAHARPLRVFSIHGPVGERGYVRTMHEILDRIASVSSGADVVLGGDFNVAVGYRDHPRERLSISRGERTILDRLRDDFGLVSCWQAAHPDRPLAQTLRWTANRKAPYHCDGIFVPVSWIERLVVCRVVRGSRWKQLSDHNPVVAEFSIGT